MATTKFDKPVGTEISQLNSKITNISNKLAINSFQISSYANSQAITRLRGWLVRTNGIVMLTGRWEGVATNSTTILTIPNGYRPSGTVYGSGMCDTANDQGISSEYIINSSGEVTQAQVAGNTIKGIFTFFYALD